MGHIVNLFFFIIFVTHRFRLKRKTNEKEKKIFEMYVSLYRRTTVVDSNVKKTNKRKRKKIKASLPRGVIGATVLNIYICQNMVQL